LIFPRSRRNPYGSLEANRGFSGTIRTPFERGEKQAPTDPPRLALNMGIIM